MVRGTRWHHGLWRKAWRALGSTRLAAFLLAATAALCALATFFPQMPESPAARPAWESAVELRYGWATGLLRRLGLLDAFRAPWFLALAALLLLNTVSCTIQRVAGLLGLLTRSPTIVMPEAFYRESVHRAEWDVSSRSESQLDIERALRRQGFRLYVAAEREATYICAERGRWVHLCTLVSHTSAAALLVILLVRPTLGWCEQIGYDPTFGPVVGVTSLFLVASVASLWIAHHRVWIRLDSQGAQMVAAGGAPIDRLAAACRRELREGPNHA